MSRSLLGRWQRGREHFAPFAGNGMFIQNTKHELNGCASIQINGTARDKVRRIAANIAKLPEPLRKSSRSTHKR